MNAPIVITIDQLRMDPGRQRPRYRRGSWRWAWQQLFDREARRRREFIAVHQALKALASRRLADWLDARMRQLWESKA
jgi:hypothetical protein